MASSHEIDRSLILLDKAGAQLRERKIKFDEAVQVGGAVEVPAAALCLGAFARKLDFLSIGTNDLINTLWPSTGATRPSPTCTTRSTRPCCASS
ncbi:MAG: hypothetical protein IPQ01_17950, partial [Zoogloea sp.]|nr:hypothetical protein [Zoogloea sp.]